MTGASVRAGHGLAGALDYIPRWLDFQMRASEQPGCVVAVAHRDAVVLEQAFGHADLSRRAALTPRHRFRVASHSKTFTAAGIMKLREQDRVRLDDPAGRYVPGLHPDIAAATVGQLLSHSAGIVRDGIDSGYWTGRRPFPDAAALLDDLGHAPTLPAGERFKYSNHGFALAGRIIEAVTGEPWAAWTAREIIAAAGLEETLPDVPVPRGVKLAQGHSLKLPLGRRVVFPSDTPTNGLAAATGFVSTAADLVRFFGRLAPGAPGRLLSAASRREMTRRHWPDPHSPLDRWYGLGTISGTFEGWNWFGHSGGFQGTLTRTSVFPEPKLAVSVLTNAADGWAHGWLDGVAHILRRFALGGAPARDVADWTGRWWSVWGAFDLVPVGHRVLVGLPGTMLPLQSVSELEISGPDTGRIALANGFGNHGEPVRRVRDGAGTVTELWLGGTKLVPEAALAKEIRARYGG